MSARLANAERPTAAAIREAAAARAHRNIHPHAEARLAMVLWSHEYAYEQNGGSMDFWDSLSDQRKRLCVDTVSAVLAAERENGRA